jgi:outer membrane protein assembly factor BamB
MKSINIKFTAATCSAILIAGISLAANASASDRDLHSNPNHGFNRPGNILIADQFNNRVIETDPAGNIVWSFGLGPNDFSAHSPIGVNDAERVGDLTLMAGTGTPAGLIPQAPDGAADNRVMLVDKSGRIVWQYGQFGITGSGPNQLNTPVQCTFLPNFHVLISDQGNNRIIEVNLRKQIVWQYPGSNTNDADQLNAPNSAELLANGHILIADESNNRVIEVTHKDKIVKTFTAGGTLGAVAFASRLDNGDTLMTDAGNSRAVEVDANDNVVWQYFTDTDPMSVPAPAPTRAVRLHNGDTLISDQFNNRVIRVSKAGQIVASYGLPLAGGGVIGNNVGYDTQTSQNGLYAPYDAKVIGDYTGLTPPYDSD